MKLRSLITGLVLIGIFINIGVVFGEDVSTNTLSYWIEHTDGKYYVWTKIPHIPANGKVVLIVHKDPSKTPNGDKVFEFFDDFDGNSLDTSKWIAIGSYSISNSKIILNPEHYTTRGQVYGLDVHNGLYSTYEIQQPVVIETKVVSHTDYVRYWFGTTGLSYGYDDGGPDWWGFHYPGGRIAKGYDVPPNGLVGIVSATITPNSFILKDPNVEYHFDYGYDDIKDIPNAKHVFVSSWSCSDTTLDWIRVRKYADKEPITTVERINSNTWKVVVSNPNNYDLTDFQVRFDGAEIVNSKNDGLSITIDSIIDDNGNVIYSSPNSPSTSSQKTEKTNTNTQKISSYWIEHTDGKYHVWTKIHNIPANGKVVLIVHKDPSKTPNGDAVFEFFDDFDGTSLDRNKWIAIGSYSISNSKIILNPEHYTTTNGQAFGLDVGNGLYSTYEIQQPVIIETKVVSHTDYVRYWFGTIRLNYRYDDGGPDWWGFYYPGGKIVKGYDVPHNGLVGIVSATIAPNSFILKDPNVEYHFDYGYNDIKDIPNVKHVLVSSWSGSDTTLDWIRVRKYADKEPITTVERINSNTWKVVVSNPNNYDLTDFQVRFDGAEIVNSKNDGLSITIDSIIDDNGNVIYSSPNSPSTSSQKTEKTNTNTQKISTEQTSTPKSSSQTSSFPKSYILLGFLVLIATVGIVKMRKRKPSESTELKPSQTSTQTTNNIPDFPQSLLNKYIPLQKLGEGGFGKVFKVKRKGGTQPIALKVPNLDEKAKKFLLKEIRAWKNLDHPNIVKMYDAFEEPIPHIEMEYVEGCTINGRKINNLEDYPKPVNPKDAIKLIKQIAEGLKHAHSKNIIHRDIKPSNILLTSNLTPKITDWGLAKIGAKSSTATTTKGLTLLYSAPEQIDEEEYGKTDKRTDIYQLGLLFYELLTGKLPYEATSLAQLSLKIINPNIKPTPPSKINPELSIFDGIFEKLLAKRKEDRFQSVDEFLNALNSLEELNKEKEELKKTLTKTTELIKKSTDKSKINRLTKELIDSITKLALNCAKANDKVGLLDALEILKDYVKSEENKKELEGAIKHVEFLIKESIPLGKDTIEKLEVLLNRIKKEWK
ncbi:DUF2341 domain-containing protein [Methanotorris igneus]|uniref:non-specific serine/threonine protein kinase n=1 Tax=Methanotorris igneus (strain DSM 5666 / JCM 11834 / Kol 5) TaxID=880724 RepID=F6BBS3_METIK|nr:DUF2341 domain-containing protein [Methanotorris igneus]AEF97203.1 serine/threonine protein kinase [Methanotorris igneus Kol 5]